MKPSRLLSIIALALSLGASLHAFAASADPAADGEKHMAMGELGDRMRASQPGDCAKAREALAGATPQQQQQAQMNVEMACSCGPRMMDAAFPADRRAQLVTGKEASARVAGAGRVCMMGAILHQIQGACAAGIDPFAQAGTPSTPAQAQARCSCITTRLQTLAARDMVAAADAAQADVVQGRPPADIKADLGGLQQACMAANGQGH